MSAFKPGGTRGRPRKHKPGWHGPYRHAAYSFLTTGQLPKDRKYLGKYLEETRDGLIHDNGPREEDLPAAKRILIDQIVTNLGALRLIQEAVREAGVLQNPTGFLHPALSTHYLSWLNSIVRALALLGVERRQQDEGPSWAEVVAEVKAERQAQDAERVLPAHEQGDDHGDEHGQLDGEDKESGHGT